jgi:hypothetical protein
VYMYARVNDTSFAFLPRMTVGHTCAPRLFCGDMELQSSNRGPNFPMVLSKSNSNSQTGHCLEVEKRVW